MEPGGRTKGPWPPEPRRCRWIVDGHNVIFGHPDLEPLQTGDRRGEARRRLEQMLERFASAQGIEMLVVYDGNRMERNPDARRSGRIRSVYSQPPEEEADDRIAALAEEWVRRGEKVVVVTSDRATLGSRLPRGAMRVDPGELFRRLPKGTRAEPERPAGDFSDIEAHFLALPPEEGPGEAPEEDEADR